MGSFANALVSKNLNLGCRSNPALNGVSQVAGNVLHRGLVGHDVDFVSGDVQVELTLIRGIGKVDSVQMRLALSDGDVLIFDVFGKG